MTKKVEKSRFAERLLLEMVAGQSLTVASEKIGCSVDHASRLSKDPEFQRRLGEIRNRAVSEVLGSLIDASRKAVTVLRELMDSESEAIRLKASSAVLSNLTNIHANIEQRNQIESLEQRIEEYERQRDAA